MTQVLTYLVVLLFFNFSYTHLVLAGDLLYYTFSFTSGFQGPLSPVGGLSFVLVNSSTIDISWSPPFTLPGTAITGYNISVTSNGTTTNYFTSDSYYVLQLSDITDSPCNEINITVSGYNGLDGESKEIQRMPCGESTGMFSYVISMFIFIHTIIHHLNIHIVQNNVFCLAHQIMYR